MNKPIKIGIVTTIILTLFAGLTGFFEGFFEYHIGILFSINAGVLTLGLNTSGLNAQDYINSYINGFQLSSAFLMLGICLNITSIFVEKRKIGWFYGSLLIIVIGIVMEAVIRSIEIPAQIFGSLQVYNLESFLIIFSYILFSNLKIVFLTILLSPTIIYPYLEFSINIASFYYMFDFIAFNGFKGVLLIVGQLHIYPELFAVYLAFIAGARLSLKSFQSYLSIMGEGLKNTFKTIKNAMVCEFKSTMPKVVVLLIIAALLETLWTPFWINYWLQHIL